MTRTEAIALSAEIRADVRRELAQEIEEQFTPFAIRCKDPGCMCKDGMKSADWAAYYKLLDIVGWLRGETH